MEYHASSAHWVVAELIERVTGKDYRTFLYDEVIAPLGLEHLRLGVDPTDGKDIVDVELVGQATAEGNERGGGIAEINDTTLLRYNDADVRAIGVPGGGGVSTAADIALLYQAILHNEPRLWDPEVLADGTGHVRNVFVDPLRGVPANRTLGLVVAGDDPQGALVREFGRATGPRAFGASGVGGQIAWADPDSGLSFCWLTNGLDADIVAMFKRSASLSTRAAKCVPSQGAL
jgi:CubicO group peptidase (beta-lactamase class C family)